MGSSVVPGWPSPTCSGGDLTIHTKRLRERVYSSPNPVGEVARFALEVAEAAREGDSVAEEIWAIAAREVAQTATAALGGIFAPRPL